MMELKKASAENYVEVAMIIAARKAEYLRELTNRENPKTKEKELSVEALEKLISSMDNNSFLTDEEKRTKKINPKLRLKDLNLKLAD